MKALAVIFIFLAYRGKRGCKKKREKKRRIVVRENG